MSVLRRGYVPVEPDTTGFDEKLKEDLKRKDPGGKAGKQIGGQLNRALKRLDLPAIDVKADPKQAFAAIEATEEKLRRLSRESATVEVKIKTEQARSQLARFKKQLGDDGGDDAAQGFVSRFVGKLGPALEKAPISPPLVIAAAAAAPLIGATISAAVIGGAGIGGVIGGITLAAKDPRVKAAGTRLGNELLGDLQQDAEPFIQPIFSAIAKIEGRFVQMDDRIKHIFATSSGFLAPLVSGALDGVDGILRGVESLVTKGKPVIDALGESFGILGKSTGDALEVISGGSEESASALVNLAKATGVLIEAGGYLIRTLTDLYGIITFIPGKVIELEKWLGRQVGVQQDAGKTAAEAAVQMYKLAAGTIAVAKAGNNVVATEDNVTAAQKALTKAQQEYTSTLDALDGTFGRTTLLADGLRKATENLYGAQIAATDANESYQSSWDALSESIKANGRTLNIHTAAGRANRDALEQVATASRDMYFADVQAGTGVAAATSKHNVRIAALKEEARRSGLNRTETQKLIATYGAIPKKKQTDLVVDGVNKVVQALKDLYVFQRSLATGEPIGSIIAQLNKEKGPAKRYGGYADGGQIGGWSPHSRADNIPAMLTAKEWVHPVDAVDYYGPQVMGAIQNRQVPREVLTGFATGQLGKLGDLPFFADGGRVAPVDTSRRWPFVATMAHSRIPSRAEVASKVPIGAGPGGAFVRAQNGKPYIWASAGPAGYDCSGIVSAVYNVLHGRSPYSHTFSTGSLPGRWFTKPGIGGPLTAAWSNPGESPASATTGHMMGMVNGLTFESTGSRGVHLGASTRRLTDFAHIAHYNRGGQVPHIAMARGGVIREPVIGVGRSGTTYSFGEGGIPETVTPGVGGATTVVFNFNNAVITSKRQAVDLVVTAYNTAVRERKIKVTNP